MSVDCLRASKLVTLGYSSMSFVLYETNLHEFMLDWRYVPVTLSK